MLPTIKTILYATALGEQAPQVFRYALSIANKYKAEVVLVHVFEFISTATQPYLPDEVIAELKSSGMAKAHDTIKARLELFAKEEAPLETNGKGLLKEICVVEGRAHEAILKEAERIGADLIVMGTQRHTVVGDIFLGSTSHRVTQRSNVPVLLVRQ